MRAGALMSLLGSMSQHQQLVNGIVRKLGEVKQAKDYKEDKYIHRTLHMLDLPLTSATVANRRAPTGRNSGTDSIPPAV